MEKIYVDFDGTLFDTDKFYKDINYLCFKYGINKREVELIKKQLSMENIFDAILFFDYLTENYNVSKDIILEFNKLFCNNYVYDDVLPCLDILKDKYELILLTYGNFDFQMKKINSSNLKKYFSKIIITNKNKSTLENVLYKNSIFIDNNPKEIKMFIEVGSKKVIRIRRESDKYSKRDLKVSVSEYKSFKEIIKKEFGL